MTKKPSDKFEQLADALKSNSPMPSEIILYNALEMEAEDRLKYPWAHIPVSFPSFFERAIMDYLDSHLPPSSHE